MMYHIALDIYADVGFIAGSNIAEMKVDSDKAWYEVVEDEIVAAKAANPTASSVTLRWVKEYENLDCSKNDMGFTNYPRLFAA